MASMASPYPGKRSRRLPSRTGSAPRLRFSVATEATYAGPSSSLPMVGVPAVLSATSSLISACFAVRLRSSRVLPSTRKRASPANGMIRINSSQAMPLEGRRFLGTTPSATTLMVRSSR